MRSAITKSKRQILLFTDIESTSLQEDRHVRPQVRPGKDEVQRMPVGYGPNILELCEKSPLPGSLLKTLITSSTWGSTRFSMTWQAKVISANRFLFLLRRSGQGTIGLDFGSLVLKATHMIPTPTASDHIERKCTNKGASAGELNFETNKSVSLDRWFRKAYGKALTPEFSEVLMGFPIGWTELRPSEMPLSHN